MGRPTIIELNYHCHETLSMEEIVQLHQPSSGYLHKLKDKAHVQFVKHGRERGSLDRFGIKYVFFRRRNKFWQIPFATHRYIKRQKPDVVLVQGLVFPWQVMVLRWWLGKRTKLVVQHHGEQPWQGFKGRMQQWADRYIAAYTFTAMGNAQLWLDAGVIASADKCVEVMEAAPSMFKLKKEEAQQKTGMTGSPNFLWVGRLISDKDPLTVYSAFQAYLVHNPVAQLYMIYNDVDKRIVDMLQYAMRDNAMAKKAIHFIGEVEKSTMSAWYCAADFFVAASRREGSGYALLEAMHCGCIPLVTDIPSFRKITMDGRLGFLYPPGQAQSLIDVMMRVEYIDKTSYRSAIFIHARENLSHTAMAKALLELVDKLIG